MVVNDFLVKYFDTIMDYNFTAKVEEQFDIIAEGKEKWENMLNDFYKPFHVQVEETLEVSEKANGERELGTDPKTGKLLTLPLAGLALTCVTTTNLFQLAKIMTRLP
jgi:DNA topoisomerase-1